MGVHSILETFTRKSRSSLLQLREDICNVENSIINAIENTKTKKEDLIILSSYSVAMGALASFWIYMSNDAKNCNNIKFSSIIISGSIGGFIGLNTSLLLDKLVTKIIKVNKNVFLLTSVAGMFSGGILSSIVLPRYLDNNSLNSILQSILRFS